MATATAMYHSGRNPLRRISYKRGEKISPVRDLDKRRLHKALLRYHDEANWPLIREYLQTAGRAELIGDGENCLIPAEDARASGHKGAKKTRHFSTQHVRRKSTLGNGRKPKGRRRLQS